MVKLSPMFVEYILIWTRPKRSVDRNVASYIKSNVGVDFLLKQGENLA